MANLTRYRSPFELFTRFNQEMNDLFARPFFGGGSQLAESWPQAGAIYTPIDFGETEDELVLKVDMPGLNEADIKVNCTNETLSITGERKEEKSETKGNVLYRERQYGSFMRSVSLPCPIKNEAVRARYKDGVLEVHLPKAQKSPTREIKVERTK